MVKIGRRLPAEPGVWLLVVGDGILFSLLFGIFMYYRALDVRLFQESKTTLNQNLGLVNTILLLTSSWLVAAGIQFIRKGEKSTFFNCFSLASFFGFLFIIIKFIEYSYKLSSGVEIINNNFYMLYFVYTGIHLIHVFIGSLVLLGVVIYSHDKQINNTILVASESGAIFWHLVDLLWIALFALFYLV